MFQSHGKFFSMVGFAANIKTAGLAEADGGNDGLAAHNAFFVAVPGDGIIPVAVIVKQCGVEFDSR